MTVRSQQQERREMLKKTIQNICEKAPSSGKHMLPTFRDMAEKHDLSLTMVHNVVKQMERDGLVRTVKGSGTFVLPRAQAVQEYYLFLMDVPAVSGPKGGSLEDGFTTRIAELGGASLSLPLKAILTAEQSGALPKIAGLFVGSQDRALLETRCALCELPRVAVAGYEQDVRHTDAVSFDDIGGGRIATRHLLELKHQHIAFLASHAPGGPSSRMRWSGLREQGWRETMAAVGLSSDGLLFLLSHEPEAETRVGGPQTVALADEAARLLVQQPEITAVVAANDWAAQGILKALHQMGKPRDHWPAIVGFDDLPDTRGRILTSLRLPWEELGRLSADLLWQRSQGQLTGPPVHRHAPMRLQTRISSQAGWTRWLKHAAL